MQALRLASRSLLRARIDRGTLRVLRGDRLLYKSDALLGHCCYWQKGSGARAGVDALFYFSAVHYTALLVLDANRAVLELGPLARLQLRQPQDACVALWIARHVRVKHGQDVWQQFADDLIQVIKA
jgi:hypothetical protein